MSEELLPLFPLPVVLFPNSILQLHIFEDRYRQLIEECVWEKKAFGINLVQGNEVSRVGCTAIVTQILKKYENGRMDILVQGQLRYSLRRLVTTPALYGVGSVMYEAESDTEVDSGLAGETVRLHNRLVSLVYGENAFEIVRGEENANLSYKIAQKAGMELVQRQKLLETNSENERLEMLRQYFLQMIPRLKNLGEIERVIKSDGYIVNS